LSVGGGRASVENSTGGDAKPNWRNDGRKASNTYRSRSSTLTLGSCNLGNPRIKAVCGLADELPIPPP
jgi:hypothetical protein